MLEVLWSRRLSIVHKHKRDRVSIMGKVDNKGRVIG